MPAPLKPLSIRDILKWADQHHAWTGRWPISRDGQVLGQTGQTWEGVNDALRKGGRGLPGGDSLHRLLTRRRRVLDARRIRPELTREQIIEWIRMHHLRTGRWPTRDSGPVSSAPDITWSTVSRTLRRGGKNLHGGESLKSLLRKEFFLWSSRGNRPLSIPLILKWADDHHARTGRWPIVMSGKVPRQTHTWAAINEALKHGRCGLKGDSSVARLLREHRGEAYDKRLARLTESQIVEWAEQHFRRKRRWPRVRKDFCDPARLPWSTINRALREGRQGLPGGSSLAQALASRRRGAAAAR